MANRINAAELDLQEQLVALNRVSKTVKGGRIARFAAIMVVGDGNGHVGFGLGKAAEVPDAIRKGIEDAKKNMIKVSLTGSTIPHEIVGEYGAGKVLLKPAGPGTGIIAGGTVRTILALAARALEKGISAVVFDRGGYIYHGRVSELAEGAREGGLKF